MKKYKMTSFLLVSTIAYMGSVASFDAPIWQSKAFIITSMAFVVAISFGAFQIYESEKENEEQRALHKYIQYREAEKNILSLPDRLELYDRYRFSQKEIKIIQANGYNTFNLPEI